MRLCYFLGFGVVAASLWLVGRGQAVERQSLASRAQTPEIALHYDLFVVDGALVGDASGKRHDGVILRGEIVPGRKKDALRLDGDGSLAMPDVPETFDPKSRPFTVGAFCQPAAADGVIASMGDKANGFSLFLKGGVPHLAVRSNGELAQVIADEPVVAGQWVHLAGSIDGGGTLRLMVNGWPVAESSGKLIQRRPTEPFCAGADPGSPVGDYPSPLHWRGLLQEIRVYWGALDRNENRDQWGDWADLPGCGCGK